MISLEAYRACIGTYQQKNIISHKTFCHYRDLNNNRLLFETIYSHLPIYLGILILINVSFLKMSLLIQHGDIETNPEPVYTLMKSVTASYHQGDISMFGETAGRQCLCNSIYAIVWSMLKTIGTWNEQDLNHILNEGDKLYKAKNTCNFLSTDDLPKSIKLNEAEFNVVKLSNYHGRLSCFETFISNVHKNEENTGNGLVLIFNGFSVSVIWNEAYYFLFDPHSRDSNGLMCENGTAVLLKFHSLLVIEKYLLEAYVNIGDIMLIDLQYVELLCHDEVDFQCINSVKSVRAKKRKYDAFKNSENYKNIMVKNMLYKTENYECILKKTYSTKLKIVNILNSQTKIIKQKKIH